MALWGGAFKLLWLTKPLVYCGFGASKRDSLCGIVFWSFCRESVIENHTCFGSVSFCVLWIWLCLCGALSGGWGHGFKLLWLTKPLVYCGFEVSKGDTLCGSVF